MRVEFFPLQKKNKLVFGQILVQLLGKVSKLSLVVVDDESDAGCVWAFASDGSESVIYR